MPSVFYILPIGSSQETFDKIEILAKEEGAEDTTFESEVESQEIIGHSVFDVSSSFFDDPGSFSRSLARARKFAKKIKQFAGVNQVRIIT